MLKIDLQKIILNLVTLLFCCFMATKAKAETYTREYDPTASTDSISIADLNKEWDKISRTLKNIEASNITDASLTSSDILTGTLDTTKIGATLTASDYANLDAIAAGSMIYASALSTFDDIAIGANATYLKMSASTFPTWGTAPSQAFTDGTGIVYSASADDNVTIGGATVGTSGKAVLTLNNGTIPSTSPSNAVQLYAEDVTDTTVKLLLNLNGTDGSQTFTDSSSYSKTVSYAGATQEDTGQSKYGGASCLFDGLGDYLSAADSADWYFGTGDFTIDFWYRPNNFIAPVRHPFMWQYVDDNNYQILFIDDTYMYYTVIDGGVTIANYSYTYSFSTGNWYHIALVRSGTSIKIFINGVSQTLTVSTAIGSSAVPNLAAAYEIGGTSLLGTYCINGWLDDYRVVKGDALWTADFTTPASELICEIISELKVRDEAGNITQKSPHDLSFIPLDKLKGYYFPFSFISKNEILGLEIKVDYEGFLKEVETLSNKKILYKKEDEL